MMDIIYLSSRYLIVAIAIETFVLVKRPSHRWTSTKSVVLCMTIISFCSLNSWHHLLEEMSEVGSEYDKHFETISYVAVR